MAARPYSTAAWTRVRALQLRRSPLCVFCVLMGLTKQATDVDHIEALSDGGAAFDFENLRSLCRECHSRVTSAWRAGRDQVVLGVNPETGHPVLIDRTRRE